MTRLKSYFALFLSLLILSKCGPVTSLRQGYLKSKVSLPVEKVDCILSDNIFYNTPDYTLLQCGKSPNDFYYIPDRLVVENDFNENPLVFSQFIRKDYVNVIVKYSYQKDKYIEAYSYLKSINTAYSLHILPINSIDISNSTSLPDKGIYYFGKPSYGFFEGYIVFEIKGKRRVSSMRNILLGTNGFQMIYQFRFLIDRGGTLIQKVTQIPIYINNINF